MGSENRIITLLTDFGNRDAYVGIMKGVIASLCPRVRIIDLTHEIPPQDLWAARFNLLNAVPYFPPETIHVVVVDPGVGTARRGIAVKTDTGVLVGPDNGVMSGEWQQSSIQQAVELTNRDYWRGANPSTTFQGRDIFAPVAAYVARGVPLSSLGDVLPAESLTRLDLPSIVSSGQEMRGVIQHIDHFGNAITTISADALGDGHIRGVTVHQTHLPWHLAYGAVEPGQPLALIGSHGWVEVAVNQGNGKDQLRLQVGDPVTVKVTEVF